MPRPKKIPEYQEGPETAQKFVRTMQKIIAAGRPKALVTERVEQTTVTVETLDVVGRAKPKRRR